jgi:hypothetical protein
MVSSWKPYYVLISGWLFGWLLSLGATLLLDSYTALQLALPVTGMVTGYLLWPGRPIHRLLLGGILAVSWSSPIFVSLVADFWWLTLVGLAVAGLVTSLVILLYPAHARNGRLGK